MDNSRYYNDSLAYDFDMFMPKEEKTSKAKIVKMPQKKQRTARKAASIAIGEHIKSAVIIAFVVAVVCANIFLRVRITETNNEITNLKAEIVELESEHTRLSVEFENRISYKNIEEAALELGMKKMDKSQVVYIKTNTKNAALTSDGIVTAAQN